MKKIVCLACILCLLLSGCGTDQTQNSETQIIDIYCLQISGEHTEPRHLVPVKRSFSADLTSQELAESIVAEMKNMDNYDKVSALPPQITAEQIIFYGNSIVVNLSKEYNSLSAIDKSIAAGAIALTLTQLESINFVKISCADPKHDQANDFYLGEDSVIISEDVIKFNTFDTEIFAVNTHTNKIQKSKITIKTEQNKILLNMVFGELMKKPADEKLQSSIPSGMVARSIKLNSGVCAIDFMAAGTDKVRQLDRLHIAAIVNSFCLQPDVKAVTITVDGEKLSKYNIIGYDGELGYSKIYE